MMLIDPLELLACHQHLLQQDYISLGEGSYVNSQYVLAQCHWAHVAALSLCSQDKQHLYSSEPPRLQINKINNLSTKHQVTSPLLDLSWDCMCPLRYETT